MMCAVWALVRVLGIERGFPFVALMSYTLFVVPIALLALGLGLALRQWSAAALAGAAAIALLAVITPRAIGGPDEVEGRPLRVMTANVLAGNADPGALLELTRDYDIDVLTVQELNPKYARGLERRRIAALLPHSALSVARGVTGSGIYSRFPVRRIASDDLASTRGVIELDSGDRVGVVSVHNLPLPSSAAGTRSWAAGLRQLPEASASGPVQLLLGDFNATLDQAEFRDLLDRGYADAGERFGAGLTPTWPMLARPSRYMAVTIDHLLYDRERVGIRDYRVLDLPRTDHDPLYAELVLRGG